MDDEALACRAVTGEEDAYEVWMGQIYPKALRLCYLILNDANECEDVLQEAFLICYQKRRTLRNADGLNAYFYRTMTHLAWKNAKKRRRETPVEETPERIEGSPGPEESALRQAMKAALFAQVQQLPVKQRTVVIYYYYEQRSIREIAHLTGTLEATVKSRLFFARKKLRETFKSWEEAE